jgi:hypothetical protein
MGAMNSRFSQYFERGDRHGNPGIELVAQEAKPNPAAFNQTWATHLGTGRGQQILAHGDLLLDKPSYNVSITHFVIIRALLMFCQVKCEQYSYIFKTHQ